MRKDGDMRVFKVYSAKRIAKYVRSFFKGTLTIVGYGEFRFDGGRMIVEVGYGIDALRICREVNSEIGALANMAPKPVSAFE